MKDNLALRKIQILLNKLMVKIYGEEKWESRRFLKRIGKYPNLKSPKSLNEKIAWLKINYLESFFLKCCDKYLIREYLKEKLGKDYAPPLIYVTENPKNLTFKNINKFPCIIKVSNGSGANLIIKNKNEYSEKYLQFFFKKQILLSKLHTVVSLEHQYEVEKPYIVVEELLMDDNGGIPNDYKFLYINGELEFIYCSVDRLGDNVRHVYDKDWNRLHFAWVAGANEKVFKRYDKSKSIPQPRFFPKMKDISKKLAKDFPLVRIDFYETSDRIYVGEITLHHGSGHDRFYPESFDELYGEKLVLPSANRFH